MSKALLWRALLVVVYIVLWSLFLMDRVDVRKASVLFDMISFYDFVFVSSADVCQF